MDQSGGLLLRAIFQMSLQHYTLLLAVRSMCGHSQDLRCKHNQISHLQWNSKVSGVIKRNHVMSIFPSFFTKFLVECLGKNMST